jgi:hypothetical protein
MPLTETTRRCAACSALLLDGQVACAECGSVPCPPVDSWPGDTAVWLAAMELALYLRPMLHFTRQQRAEFLLRGVVAGHQWDDKLVKLAAPATECLPIAVLQAERWAAAGKPREAETMITLARIR